MEGEEGAVPDAFVGVEAELAVDDYAVDVEVVSGGHGEDLIGLDDLVVSGEVEEGVGDAAGEGEGVSLGDGLLIVDAEDDEVVAELLGDGFEVGHLFEAEVAPAGPEIDYDGLFSEEVVEADRVAGGVGEGEVGGGVSDACADPVGTTVKVGVFDDAEVGGLLGEGVGEGKNDGGDAGQADGEDDALLEEGEGLEV